MTLIIGNRFSLFKRIRKRKRSSSLGYKSSTKSLKELVRSKSTKSLVSRKVAREVIGRATDFRKCANQGSKLLHNVHLKKDEDSDDDTTKINSLIYENENLSREVENLRVRLRDVERQLHYERVFYEEQKTQYVKEMRSRRVSRCVKTQTNPSDFIYEPEEIAALVTELRNVREMYLKQKSLTARVCDKYVKLKEYKDLLIRRMVKAESDTRRIIEDLMRSFDEDRIAFSLLEKDEPLPKTIHEGVVRKISRLSYNNAALQMELKRLEFEKLKNRGNDLMSDYTVYSVLREMLDCKDYADEETRKRLYHKERSYIALPIEYDEDGQKLYKLTPLFQVLNSTVIPSKDVGLTNPRSSQSSPKLGLQSDSQVTEISEVSSSVLGDVKEMIGRSESAPDIIQQAVR